MTLSLAIILILKFMPFMKFLKKQINKKNKLMSKQKLLTQEEQQIVDAICVAEKKYSERLGSF
jgi:hypothetical protein